MKVKTGLMLVIAVFLVSISAGAVLAQEQAVQPKTGPETTPEAQNEPDIQWAWGEVITLDALNKALTIKYLDYETDQEKEINVTVDDKTSYENIKSIDELKPQDTVSVDYIVSPEGKNIATTISLEMPEAQSTPQSQAAENTTTANTSNTAPAPQSTPSVAQ
jgi:hypothetical protein